MNFGKKLQYDFPKIHPFWKGKASLTRYHQPTNQKKRYQQPGQTSHNFFSGTGSWPLSMESLSPAKRGCRFKEESQTLSFHKHYSRTNCVFECSLKKAMEELQCVPRYLPQMAGVVPCRFGKQTTTLDIISVLWQLFENGKIQRCYGRGGLWLLWLLTRLWGHRISVCGDLKLNQVEEYFWM